MRIDRDRWYVLAVLMLVYTLNIADRFVVSTLIEPIKAEFHLSDGAVGLLTGAAMAVFYVTAGIPLGLLADRYSRKRMIVVSLAIWSALTALCGMTHSFWQLLVVRIGVGIGEAGGTPPCQSLLADKFPPRARGFALTLFALGAALGAGLGSSLGGYLSDHHGWRMVLIVFGALGLPVALLVGLTVREPRRGQLDDIPPAADVSLSATIAFVRRQPALLHVLAGATVVTFWGWGLVWWTPAFLIRSHGMSVQQCGELLGWMHVIGGAAVTLGTAWVMKWLEACDPRWQTRFVAIATILPTFPSILAYVTTSPIVATAAMWLFVPMIYLYIGPTLALATNLVPATMRSQTCAFIVFSANVANLLIAPLAIGALSDLLGPHLADPAQSLRWVLVGTSLTGFWAAWHYWAAARHLPGDLERAGTGQG
ncbi:MFS family permease [Sphingobium sp. OAS761]|uniref:spinster family MFS transporter n=1 Tax=Sphingobium sp. OAS761 TaxID=2817901 RepID=UPI0020A0C570|nr:MFS transporter [Sphingobium sp. OAS761]MCP1469780.1 MFS family permease [Sphingobium sp. OAS761]